MDESEQLSVQPSHTGAAVRKGKGSRGKIVCFFFLHDQWSVGNLCEQKRLSIVHVILHYVAAWEQKSKRVSYSEGVEKVVVKGV